MLFSRIYIFSIVSKTSNQVIIPNLEPCTKYDITITKYLGMESSDNKSGGKETNKPIFAGETGVSITAHTSIDFDMPFTLNSLEVEQDLSSINIYWSRNELPCIDTSSMLKFQICENEDETSCMKNVDTAKNVQKPGSNMVTTKFQGLQACASYLVSSF